MYQTVVGLFDTPADAQKVRQLLISEGYAPASIRVLSNENDGLAEGAVAEARATSSGDNGVVASIKNFFHSLTSGNDPEQDYYTQRVSAGGALLAVTAADEQVESVISLLEVNGARDISEEGTATGGQDAYASTTTTGTATGNAAIPVVEEELQVGKRQVQRGGVRVYSRVVETPVEEQVRLREEHVWVQRTPVDRPASASDFGAFKEGTIELTETAEEAVVAKQARVVEEVRVGKEVSERTETIKDTVRHTQVDVEEVSGETSQGPKKPRKL